MATAYILTEEGRAYNQKGIEFVRNQIRTTFNDTSELNIAQGKIYNSPETLVKFLNKDPEHTYVFVSHANGIETLHETNDIRRFIALLNDTTDKDETSWSIIMKALGLL